MNKNEVGLFMSNTLKSSGSSTESVAQLKKDIRVSQRAVKEELGEHLDSINENTTEIQANYEYICKLEAKISKLTERLDTLQMFLRGASKADEKVNEEPSIQSLSEQEKKVFLVLYTSGKELTMKDVAEKLGMSFTLVGEYITTMIEKGVPLIKVYRDNKSYYKVGQRFIDKQARENVLNIGQRTLV